MKKKIYIALLVAVLVALALPTVVMAKKPPFKIPEPPPEPIEIVLPVEPIPLDPIDFGLIFIGAPVYVYPFDPLIPIPVQPVDAE